MSEVIYRGKKYDDSDNLTAIALAKTGVGTFHYYPQEKLVFVPKRTQEEFGCNWVYEDMPYSYAKRFVHEDDWEEFADMYAAIDAGAEKSETIIRYKDGSAMIHVTMVPIERDENDKPILVLGFAESVLEDYRFKERERIKLQQAYHEQELQLREITVLNDELQAAYDCLERQAIRSGMQEKTVAEAIQGGFKIGKNDPAFTFKYVSKQLAQMAGYDTVEEFMEASGGAMSGIVNHEDTALAMPAALKAVAEGRMYEMNYRIRCKDGSWKHVVDRGRLIQTEGAEPEYWSFVMDKDELALAEELNEKLKSAMKEANAANDAKTTFLFNMSHDIRTPMNAILGFTELLEDNKDNPEKISDYVKKIKVSGEYLLTIINNVLDMARIESGKVELDLDCCNIMSNDMAKIPIFDEILKEKNLTMNSTVNVEHPHIMADVAKMGQIWVNLISNAIKYTPKGGTITMDIHEVPCEREGYVTYVSSISDTGIGMSSEFVEHIFDAFTRERNTTESKVIGTGLGMAIVKKLVDLMGGSITVESELGKGTTFTVTMTHQIVRDPEEYRKREVKDEVDLSIFEGKHLLLAEDNDLNAEIAVTILERYGFTVDRAADGIECLKMLTDSPEQYYDLIIMDIQMPNLDGYQTTEKIRDAKSEIPIIAMTANAFEEDKRKAIAYGMNGHIAKPIKVHRLVKLLAEILEEK